MSQDAAGQELAELPLDEPGQAVPAAMRCRLAEEGIEMLPDHAVEHRMLGVTGPIRLLGLRHAPE